MQKMTGKQRAWQKRIVDWSESGLSQADYCRRHGIQPKRFYSWKNRLEKLNGSPAPVVSQGNFLPVELIDKDRERQRAAVLLRVNGIEIHYTHTTDEILLLKAIALMEARA